MTIKVQGPDNGLTQVLQRWVNEDLLLSGTSDWKATAEHKKGFLNGFEFAMECRLGDHCLANCFAISDLEVHMTRCPLDDLLLVRWRNLFEQMRASIEELLVGPVEEDQPT